MKPKVHHRVYKRPSPVPILSQINPLHASTSHFLKIHLNIFLTSMPESYKWSPSLRFPHQNPVRTSPLPHACYMPPPHLKSLDLIIRISGEEYRSLSSTSCNFLHSPVILFLLGQNFSSAPCSQTPSAYIPPLVWVTRFHTHTKQ